jgi:AcrR family transcriptional regulator
MATVHRTTSGAEIRKRLLGAATAYFARHGTADVSLRTLAAAVGTSHRMLIYHFGSKEQLLVDVVRSMEDAQREALAALGAEHDPAGAVRAFWRRLSDPALAPFERLFFEVYGQALQGRAWAKPLLDGIVDDWVSAAVAQLRGGGLSPADARAEARLALAVTRGLLLDLLATGDRRAVTAAAERFFARYDGMAVSPSPSRRPRRRSAR